MHSLKNTVVAVCLLAVSFGLYHISLNPESMVDPSEIPSLDISDGLSADDPSRREGIKSEPGLPSFPDFGTSKPEALPTSPNAGRSVAANPNAAGSAANAFPGERVPIELIKEDNVQKIQYPEVAANSFATVKPELQTEIAQHELVDTSRDEGLIEVLQQQQNASPTPHDLQNVAQPIASNDSTFNGLATKLEAVDTDSGGFEFGVEEPNSLERDPGNLDFNAAFLKAEQFIEAAEFRMALELLSRFYRDDNLTGPQRQRLLPTLDALAGKVIYSGEHHLVPQPHVVRTNESLVDIAAQWNVPAQLIYNVHQRILKNPVTDLQPGTELKVIPGPFHGQIDLQAKVMTLFLGDLYAGRFPIRVGISGVPQPGNYRVVVKSKAGHAWRDSNGVDYQPGSPQNGYGPNWIGLTGSLCIHEVPADAADGHHGCIGLNGKDASDVFAILSEKSEMTIVR